MESQGSLKKKFLIKMGIPTSINHCQVIRSSNYSHVCFFNYLKDKLRLVRLVQCICMASTAGSAPDAKGTQMKAAHLLPSS